MADVRGFRGIRYADDLVEKAGVDLIAPPYDVIDEDEQAELYDRHPNNVIRLILNRKGPEDSEENNRYTRSRRHLIDWLAKGVLEQDARPAMYAHYQDYSGTSGTEQTRRGFLGLVKLTEYDREVVLPHERTLRGPKRDRLKLMKACECNMSPVFLLYDDPESKVDEILAEHRPEDPALDVRTEHDGIRHRVWPVTDGEAQCKVAGFLDDEQLLIADGHHRYETALAYRDFRRRCAEEPIEDPPYDYALAFFVNMRDPGLQIFPTHRIVHGVDGFDAHDLAETLRESSHFVVKWLDVDAGDQTDATLEQLEQSGEKGASFVFLAEEYDRPLLVRFAGDVDSPVFDPDTGDEVRRLDTAILHEAILDRMIGIDREAQEAKTNIRYTRDLDRAVTAADEPRNQLVVLMNATEVGEVVDVCKSGGKMPQKSTYFYPKVSSGLVVNPV